MAVIQCNIQCVLCYDLYQWFSAYFALWTPSGRSACLEGPPDTHGEHSRQKKISYLIL